MNYEQVEPKVGNDNRTESNSMSLNSLTNDLRGNLSEIYASMENIGKNAMNAFPDSDKLLADLFGDSNSHLPGVEQKLVADPVDGLNDQDRAAVDNIELKLESDNSESQARRNIETELTLCNGADRSRAIKQLDRDTHDTRSTSPWIITADQNAPGGYRVTHR